MKATKIMIEHEFNRRVELLLGVVNHLKSDTNRYFNKDSDREVWVKLLNNAFDTIENKLDDLKELANEWEKADE